MNQRILVADVCVPFGGRIGVTVARVPGLVISWAVLSATQRQRRA
jgi:hypothetical protein